MRYLYILLFILSLTNLALTQNGIIAGLVKDAESRLPLSGANITVQDSQIGTMSNDQGEFRIKKVASGQHTLVISYIGYETSKLQIEIWPNRTTEVSVELEPTVIKTSGVMVIATRYRKELKDVALPVSAITSEDILAIASQTVADALKTTPGISLGRDGAWGTRIIVRGLTNNNLVTLIDGNRVDTATEIAAGLSLIALDDIERLEVIRGAGSSLYGTGAIGGVVNLITREGHYNEHFYLKAALEAGYGSVNDFGAGSIQLSLGDSWWYTRLSGALRNAENVHTPDGTLKNSQFSDNNIAVKIGIKPVEKHEIKFNYQKFKAEDVGIPGAAPLFPDQADVRYPDEKREMFSVNYIGRNWSSFLRQTSVKYFFQNIDRNVENIPHIVKDSPATNGQPPKRVSVLKVLPEAEHRTDGIQFQSDWLIGKHQYVILGLDYWKKEYIGFREKRQKIELLNAPDGSVMKTIHKAIFEKPLPNSSYASIGIYGQDEIRLVRDRLTISLGGRFDRINIKNDEVLNPLYDITNGIRNDQPTNQTILWEAQEAHDQSWSANLGILYQLNESVRFTFTAAKSFRSPYLEERYLYVDLGNLVKIGDPNLKPEKGLFADFGIQFHHNNFWFSGNVFVNHLVDLVVDERSTFEDRAALKKTNVGKARLAGFDARVDWGVYKNVSAYGNIAYVRGEDLRQSSALPLIPPLNGKLGVHWNLTRFLDLELSAPMFAKQIRIAEGEWKTPGYTLFDIYLNSKPWATGFFKNRFVLGIENITNKAYRNHLATNRGSILAEPGRNFIAKWKLEF